MFGAPSSGGLFGGASSSGGGGLFGGATSGGLFGGSASSGGSIFGGASSGGGGLFGGATSSGGGGIFGSAPSSGGVFGGATSSGGLFGGATSSGGLFGATATTGGGGLFGATSGGGGMFGATATTGGGGLFGATSGGGGLFGATSGGGGMFGATSGGGLFGATSGGGGLFGATSGGGGMFGATSGGGGLFGGASSSGGGMFGQSSGGVGLGAGQMQMPVDAMQQLYNLQSRLTQMTPVLQRAMSMQSPELPQMQQSFLAFTYEWVDNPMILQQACQFNPQYHIDKGKFDQAMQNNPDPRNCAPKRLLGLKDVKDRLAEQDQKMQILRQGTEDLEKAFENLKANLQVKSLKKLEECRERHQQLSKQLLQVVAALETYAVHNGAARRSPHVEAQLEDRFSRLEDAVHAPASARARLEELWVVLQSLLQRGPPVGGPARMSDAEADKTLLLTADMGELLEQLQEELARRKGDIQHFESTLQRFNSAPLAPQTI